MLSGEELRNSLEQKQFTSVKNNMNRNQIHNLSNYLEEEKMKQIMKNKSFLAIVLCATLIFSIFTVPMQASAAVATKRILSVSGDATITVIPNMAVVTIGVQSINKDLKLAYADNKAKMSAVFSELKKLGIADKDMKTISFNVSPYYEYINNSSIQTGYIISNILSINVRKIDDLGSVIEASLLQESNVINNIEFKMSDSTKYYQEALKLAVRNAKGKASIMAAELGYKKITPVLLRENSVSVSGPIYFGQATKEGGAPVSSGSIEIKASVYMEYSY